MEFAAHISAVCAKCSSEPEPTHQHEALQPNREVCAASWAYDRKPSIMLWQTEYSHRYLSGVLHLRYRLDHGVGI